jgi:elongation factor G
MIVDRLRAIPIPLQLPLGSEETSKVLSILIHQKAWHFDNNPDVEPREVAIPENMVEKVRDYRHQLIERLGESDDQ